jgi:glutathione synthase/RimK-type ligase-like ATP-grasp enzyme
LNELPFPDSAWEQACVVRLGVAHLTRLAFQGCDLYPMWSDMMDRVTDDAVGSGLGMDLSVIAQLRGDKPTGLAIQRDSLKLHQVFSTGTRPCATSLRVLALAAASDMGANTPIDFLTAGQDIALATLYLGPGVPVPAQIPAHDVAIVVAPSSEDGEHALAVIEKLAENWPVPVLNRPAQIRELERDRLYRNLAGIAGLIIPPTLRLTRATLKSGNDLQFPLIIRPLGSHAGFGLAKVDDAPGLRSYLEQRREDNFFVSPFMDYSGKDRLFRKYRIAMIDGRPFPVHMAIAEEWKVWYLNADMALNVAHRAEEAKFMQLFDENFGRRHASTLAQLAERVGLDYFLIDCAETSDGALLIFEADHCAIVHDMDPVNVYPYKPGAMKNLFEAFGGMLRRRSPAAASRAA